MDDPEPTPWTCDSISNLKLNLLSKFKHYYSLIFFFFISFLCFFFFFVFFFVFSRPGRFKQFNCTRKKRKSWLLLWKILLFQSVQIVDSSSASHRPVQSSVLAISRRHVTGLNKPPGLNKQWPTTRYICLCKRFPIFGYLSFNLHLERSRY